MLFEDFFLTGINKVYIKLNVLFASTAPAIKREFELDFKAIEGDEDVLVVNLPKLRTVDMDDVLEAASIPQDLLRAYGNVNRSFNQSSSVNSVNDIASLLDLTIAKISSADIQVAMQSLVQLEDVFKKMKTSEEILKRVDQVGTYLGINVVLFF